ncbi:pyridoxal phosphate-dependent decarboxylase family protein [Phaeovulum vinaykumarii]|uniref:Aromatic-L-amino-acid decarboxylase n=1 Tax=Phaeovulum vinaykumarii TaxID=407234 RepID=A0A1N7LH66_9RHOB|nr:pyridoxal-dependent decarboxylase [Phaeovulum vinaykumarii]SIS73172.1 aromatic-L-amino-acid decarboxylase [Phaeovulum vinaykumarii]SOC04639.1 aromatic-L-amino-acid decarboxylase [Phaeovulum vinaykumarii]
MNHDDLRDWSKRAADWAHAYHAGLRARPVRPDIAPGTLAARLPAAPPEGPEPMEAIWSDFLDLVPEGLTHWQHPRFFAYFPANAAPASMLAEQLVNAIAAQAMLWQTAPIATEMEEVMVAWMAQALGLEQRRGVIHDSATTATLSAVLTMRERALGWAGLEDGLSGGPRVRIYASDQVHSSVDKAVRVAGIGQSNLVRIPTDAGGAMQAQALAAAIAADRAAGALPAGVVVCAGGTGVGAFDRVGEIVDLARAEGLMSHVDAAWAGSAMICPEFRPLWAGAERADSVVMNPHKWLGAQFDCSIQFLADPGPQIRTLGLRPSYLETPGQDEITNFNEWTVPLGRRFRALKLWFLLRAEGLEGLRARLRNHVAWAEAAAQDLARLPGVEIVTPPSLSLFSFALASEAATEALLTRINADGRIYLTQTRHRGRYVIRVQVGPYATTAEDVAMIARVVEELL